MKFYKYISRYSSILLLMLLIGASVSATAQNDSLFVLRMEIEEGDTVLCNDLDGFVFIGDSKPMSARDKKRYGRLRKKVIKAYPYAQVTQKLLVTYDRELAKLGTEKERKLYLDVAEEELKAEFEGEIRDMTVSEGKILIKLIDRETGDTSFELIKKLKGGFTAFMYQSIARLFGSDLKSQYDPSGDDHLIEELVAQIERGEIYVPPKQAITTKAQERLDRKTRRLEKRQRRLERKASESVAKAD